MSQKALQPVTVIENAAGAALPQLVVIASSMVSLSVVEFLAAPLLSPTSAR